MKSSRQPYQAPELIILGLSVKDNSNPTSKAHADHEATPFSSISGGTWEHYGTRGAHTAHHNYRTAHVS